MSSKAAPVTRQIKLPMSKAVEIAWKSIRQRLSRSMLVTSSIILALAFLCSIMATETLVEGMRQWTQVTPESESHQNLKVRRDKLDAEVKALETQLRTAVQNTPPAPAGTLAFDPKSAFGVDTWDEVKTRLGGPLPVPAGDLTKLLTAQPAMVQSMQVLIDSTIQRRQVREELNHPEDIKALMASKGVPTEPAEIEANRMQTKWIIGLALLVAFVGILNAMLMSVTERFREIGTMKCLGALDGFIVKLFLLESLFQGVVGTVLGILVGLGVSFGMAGLTYGGAAFYNVLWNDIGWAVLISMIVGMVLSVGGAILPALQAARMEPIAAMRSEA
ncbi:MAG TPA: ABC transporter permease [Tepidisphaeraceae bacterium]|jgi:predicted outer membrane lipoprotein